jgi:hypothetical protein
VAADDSGECGGKIVERIDSIELAGFDQRGDGRTVLCSRIVPGEESVLAIKGNRPDGSLNGIVIDLDAPVDQKNTKAIPVFGDVEKNSRCSSMVSRSQIRAAATTWERNTGYT